MSKKLLFVGLALAFVLALSGCVNLPPAVENPAATAAQRVENAGDSLKGTPLAPNTAAVVEVTPVPGAPDQASVASGSGCEIVVATRIMLLPVGSIDPATGLVCNADGSWGTTPAPSTLNDVPSGELYARTVENVDGWQRIREGVAEGEYFPWTYFTRIGCDRPLVGNEVEWNHPTLLNLYAQTADLTCQVEIKRDVDSSTNWQAIQAEMDPYDSALRGPDGKKAGERLAWFLGSNGGFVSINGQQDFLLDISVCTTCTVPTNIDQTGQLLPEQWSAPPSDTDYNTHHAAIVYPMERNMNEPIVYIIRLKKGQAAVLWQGTLIK